MAQSTTKPARKKASGNNLSHNARRFGYLVAVLVMFALIYVFRHLREWGVPLLNEEYETCLVYIQLSLYANIAANLLFFFYDNSWFKHLMHGVTNIFGALSLIMIWVFFPLDLSDPNWVKWIKIALLILFGLTIIGIIVEFIKGFRDLAKNPEKI